MGVFLLYVDIFDKQRKSFDKVYDNLGEGGGKCAIEKERSIIEATDVRDDQFIRSFKITFFILTLFYYVGISKFYAVHVDLK